VRQLRTRNKSVPVYLRWCVPAGYLGVKNIMEEALLIVATVAFGIISFVALVLGAIDLFASAARHGFIGLAVYVACWLFLGPAIAAIAFLVGLYLLYRISKRQWN